MSKERKPLTKARIEKTCADLKATRASSDQEIVLWDAVVSGYGARCRADSATLD
jgi:hypothetical protein